MFVFKVKRGEQHPGSKLANSERLRIKDQLSEGRRHVDLARDYRVSPSTIGRIDRTPRDLLSGNEDL